MSDERKRQLMQEALDDTLTPEAQRLLREYLEKDAEVASQFDRLQRVDTMLRNANFERAPARLALNIMARLVEQVKVEPREDLSSLAVTLSMALVTVVMMPVLIAASWLVLNAMAGAEVLTVAIQQTIALLVIMIESMQKLITEAQNLAAANPEAAAMVMALVPLTLLGFIRYLEENFSSSHNNQNS